jgi:hypothetical protein
VRRSQNTSLHENLYTRTREETRATVPFGMALPLIFGTTWDEFLTKWCLGNAPQHDQETVENALNALLRVWPERAAEIAAANTRGLLVISPAITNGIVLRACENLDGFEKVLRRLKTGERSASSELVFAARLVKAGFRPVLEPPLCGRFLDARIPTDVGDVYCELIAPETSDAICAIVTAATALAARLRDQNAGKRVEVLLSVDIDEGISNTVAETAKLRPVSDETWTLANVAVISKRVMADDANVGPTIPSPEVAATIGAAQCSYDGAVRTAGIVRVPVTDTRAKRLLYAESHHFSREHMNILVVDVTRIVSSLKAWGRLIEKCFQPDQNRRFGAVVLFFAGTTGEKMTASQQWKVVRNPYAERPIPESLLERILVPDSSLP